MSLLEATVSEFSADDCPRMAAALSYYTIFSLPPLLVLLMMIVGAVVDPQTVQRMLTGQVGELLGPQGAAQVESVIRNASRPEMSGLTAMLGIAGLLFGATGAFGQLQGALNAAWQVAPDPERSGLVHMAFKRVVSFGMILAVGFLLLVSLAVSALLAAFGDLLAQLLPGWATGGTLQALNAGISLLAFSLLFASMFKYLPDAVVQWRHALAGGAFTAVLFTVGKAALGYYLGRSDPGSAFGAAGSLAVTLLWIYYSALILLLGAEFTQVWARERGAPIQPEPGAVRVIRKRQRFGGEPGPAGSRAGVWWLVWAVGAAAALLLSAPAAHAQEEESPRVEEVAFAGVQNVSEDVLREGIVTEEERCKSIFYKPICWISDSGTFKFKPRLDRLELERDELRIRVMYWRRGYRQARAASAVEPAGDGVRVRFEVEEGPATRVETVVVEQTEPVLDAGRIAAVGLPEAGEPVNVIELDSATARMRLTLFERGHADAVVRDTVFEVADTLARVEIVVQPGPPITIDSVAVAGNEGVSAPTIRRLVGLRRGELFRASDLVEAQRRLYRSELFRQAMVEVGESRDSVKLVVVSVREAPFRAVRLAAGFNTIEFVQTEARFTRYDWLGGARRLDMRAAVGNLLARQLHGRSVFGSTLPEAFVGEIDDEYLSPTWQLSAEVSQPWLFSPRNEISARVFSHRRSVPGIVVDRGYGASATFTRRLTERAPVSLTYRFERTRVEGGDLYFCVNFGVCREAVIESLRGPSSLSPLWLNAHIDGSDDPLAPTRGYTARLDAEHASSATASDFHYNRVSAEASRYFPLARGVLALRVHAGWVRGSESGEANGDSPAEPTHLLHPRKRFYAGGSRSVRGYAENQLGPRILTVDPARLLEPTDSTRGEACTEETIANGTCDPSVALVDEFQPRPLGGNSVLGASVEYRHPLSDVLTAAVFVDAASVGDRGLNVPPGARRAVTPGFGIRYRSPVGPIRVDLGVRPRLSEELPVVTQVREDGELRLVRLQTLRVYDPTDASGGFLSNVFRRLQLHLSIGEAF